jgi:hypothetical protein
LDAVSDYATCCTHEYAMKPQTTEVRSWEKR